MADGSRQESFWDIEDHHSHVHVRDMTINPVTTKDVHDFCHRYHYTKTGGNMMYRWGLWHGVVLHGIVAYNLPTRQVCDSVFGAEHTTVNSETNTAIMNVLHMGRLVFADHSPRNSESKLIGGSLREIERIFPHIWGVLTYADTSQGHIGTIYQATNALYTGTGGDSTYYIDQRGERRGTYLNGDHINVQDATERGWVAHEGGVKHRYLYILGTKKQRRERRKLLRYPILPYPKLDQ